MMIAELPSSTGEMERYGVLLIYRVNDETTYAALIKLNDKDEPMPVDVTFCICESEEDDSESILLYAIEDEHAFIEAVNAFHRLEVTI